MSYKYVCSINLSLYIVTWKSTKPRREPCAPLRRCVFPHGRKDVVGSHPSAFSTALPFKVASFKGFLMCRTFSLNLCITVLPPMERLTLLLTTPSGLVYINSIRDKVLKNGVRVTRVECYQTPGGKRKTQGGKLEARSRLCSHPGFAKKNGSPPPPFGASL